jgi:hypothetical protein
VNLPIYAFDGYTFRPATTEDQPLARLWNLMDLDHTWERQFLDYWIQQNDRVNSYVLEDAIGIVFFVKAIRHGSHEVEIALQFDRSYRMVSKARAMRGMEAGFAWLKKALPRNGFKSLYFRSRSVELIGFTEKRLGFVKDGTREIYSLKEA